MECVRLALTFSSYLAGTHSVLNSANCASTFFLRLLTQVHWSLNALGASFWLFPYSFLGNSVHVSPHSSSSTAQAPLPWSYTVGHIVQCSLPAHRSDLINQAIFSHWSGIGLSIGLTQWSRHPSPSTGAGTWCEWNQHPIPGLALFPHISRNM